MEIKFNPTFTYGMLFLIYIFIVVLMYLPNTEKTGIFSMLVFYLFAHILFFSDASRIQYPTEPPTYMSKSFIFWFLFVCSLFFACSLILVSIFSAKLVVAQTKTVTNLPADTSKQGVISNYKTIFVVGETLLLFVLFMFMLFKKPINEYLSASILFLLFVIFIATYFPLSAYFSLVPFLPFSIVNVLAFVLAIVTAIGALSTGFLIYILYKLFVPSVPLNLLDLLVEYIFYIILFVILTTSTYSLFSSIWLYQQVKRII